MEQVKGGLVFHVRPCKPSDLDKVYKLSVEHASFDASPTLADTEGLYERNPGYFYVATGGAGEVIGFITGYERKGIPDEVLRTWGASRVGYIDLMAVGLAHRKKGIGTSLLNALLEQFGKDGIDIVILDVPAPVPGGLRMLDA